MFDNFTETAGIRAPQGVPIFMQFQLNDLTGYDQHHSDRGERWVLHKCDNRACVRIEHRFLGTHRDNMADMAQKGRASRGNRVYLSDSEKERMRLVYSQGGLSHPDLVIMFGVSLKTVGRTLKGV